MFGSFVEHYKQCYLYVPPENTAGVIGLNIEFFSQNNEDVPILSLK